MMVRKALAGAACVGLLITSCSSTPTPEQVTVAAYQFPENQLLAEIYAVVLENAGIAVERSYSYTERQILSADFPTGEVDLIPEYLGTLTDTVNQQLNQEEITASVATGDASETVDLLQGLLEPYEVVVADPAAAQNQLGFAVRAAYAQEKGLTTLSDLAAVSPEMNFGGPPGCQTFAFCLPLLQSTYGLQFKGFVPTDTAGPNTLNALEVGQIDLGMVFTSDPAVDARGFVILQDDLQSQDAGNITPVVRSGSASDEVMGLIGDVTGRLTTEELRKINGQVSIEGYPIEFVAARWAAEQGLLPETSVPATPAPVPPPSPTPPPPPPPEPEPEPIPAPVSYSRNQGEPSANAVSRNWGALAQCESGGDPTIISSNGLYHGLYQFSVPTWQSMGGSGAASSASADEQTYRAQILYDRAGRGQWPVCGSRL